MGFELKHSTGCGPIRGRGFATALLLLLAAPQSASAERWNPIASDGIHDPTSPASGTLQKPHRALRSLPSNPIGNKVDWVEALRTNTIRPRAATNENSSMRTLDLDVVMPNTATMQPVRFSHAVHTEWLDCGNCHDALFKRARGTRPLTMVEMLRGEACGLCHGTVAFPLNDCARCHNEPVGGAKADR